MGLTAAEKILARASGLHETRAGEIVYPNPDFVMIHDGVIMGAKEELDALGIDRLFDPDRVLMVTDHDVVYLNDRAVARGAFNRKAARAWGVKNFFDAGRGGTIGRRYTSSSSPSVAMALFTGIGLDSMKLTISSGSNR
jgi:3-isopropylmalate/(R)-2-methylmalate dehydratase large subunit